MAKLKLATKETISQPVFGPKKARLSLISWGSNKGPILECLKQFPQINFLHLNQLWPFPLDQVAQFIKNSQKVICLEANHNGQLANLIKEQTGYKTEKFLKYDGRPFWPEEIKDYLDNLLK